MGDQRQLFRFRLPWLSAATTRPVTPSRPAAETQPRTAAQTQAPSQPSATIPIQRPPFRPAGIAPVQTTSTQAQATLRPASPPRSTNQVRAASVPPSTSRRATETQVTSRAVSPSRGTTQARTPYSAPTQARAVSQPPSPSRIASQPRSIAEAVSKQQPPSRLASQPAGQTSLEPSSPPRTQVRTLFPRRPLTATQEKSQPPSSTQRPPSASQDTQPFDEAVKPSRASEVKEVPAVTVAARETPSAPIKPEEREERKKVAEEQRKATTKGSSRDDQEQKTITKLLAAATDTGTKTKELLEAAFEAGKRHQEKQEGTRRKKTWTTSSTDEKQIKTVIATYPKDGSMPNDSHQKRVSSKWEQVPLHKEIREDISKFVHNLATGQPKMSTDEKSISVLTLAGENRGASFQLGSESSKKDAPVHIHRGYKINPDDSPDATTDGDVSSRSKKAKSSMTKENPAPRAYVNGNTQCINNSLVFESSVNERNPGVHLEFSHNLAESTKSTAKVEPLEPRKAEFNIIPAETLTYEPNVRRCLRGLFAEPSDSDPDNPDKPRQHGCRYSCGEKKKEKEIETL